MREENKEEGEDWSPWGDGGAGQCDAQHDCLGCDAAEASTKGRCWEARRQWGKRSKPSWKRLM